MRRQSFRCSNMVDTKEVITILMTVFIQLSSAARLPPRLPDNSRLQSFMNPRQQPNTGIAKARLGGTAVGIGKAGQVHIHMGSVLTGPHPATLSIGQLGHGQIAVEVAKKQNLGPTIRIRAPQTTGSTTGRGTPVIDPQSTGRPEVQFNMNDLIALFGGTNNPAQPLLGQESPNSFQGAGQGGGQTAIGPFATGNNFLPQGEGPMFQSGTQVGNPELGEGPQRGTEFGNPATDTAFGQSLPTSRNGSPRDPLLSVSGPDAFGVQATRRGPFGSHFSTGGGWQGTINPSFRTSDPQVIQPAINTLSNLGRGTYTIRDPAVEGALSLVADSGRRQFSSFLSADGALTMSSGLMLQDPSAAFNSNPSPNTYVPSRGNISPKIRMSSTLYK